MVILIILFAIFIIVAGVQIYNEVSGKEDEFGGATVYNINLISGIDRATGGNSTKLYVKKDGIYMKVYPFETCSIGFDRISRVYIQNESEIRENVTLGRILTFGIFSLGMKKRTEVLKKYLVIEYLDEREKDNAIVFGDEGGVNIGQRMLNDIYKNMDESRKKYT